MEKKTKEKEGKKYTWFVEPKNDHANEVIVRPLRDQNEVNTSRLMDEQGIPHNVYEVPDYSFIARFYHSVLKSPVDFAIFRRLGDNDPIKFWARPGPKKKLINKIKKGSEE